jgi:hypothetical protein
MFAPAYDDVRHDYWTKILLVEFKPLLLVYAWEVCWHTLADLCLTNKIRQWKYKK